MGNGRKKIKIRDFLPYLVLPVFLLAGGVISNGNKFRLFSKAGYTRPVISQVEVFKDNFDSDLAAWSIDSSKPGYSFPSIEKTSDTYRGGGRLLLTFNDPGTAVIIRRALVQTVNNTVFRIFYKDSLATNYGSMFQVEAADGSHTAIGIKTSISTKNYVLRRNSLNDMGDTGIPRKNGWVMFEIVVTDKGTYGKIDNQLIYFGSNASKTPAVNTGQKSASKVALVATWGQTGKFVFDELSAYKIPSASWQESTLGVLEDFYDKYGNTSFSPVIKASDPNNIRNLLGTANSIYVYGKKISNEAVWIKGRDLFKQAVININWEYNDRYKSWASGVYIAPLAMGLRMMQSDLDATFLNQAKQILYSEANKYILFKDDFENGLAKWNSVYSSGTLNKVATQSTVKYGGQSALMMKYSDPASFIKTETNIPTFADSHSSSVHAQIYFYDPYDVNIPETLVLGAFWTIIGHDGNKIGLGVKNSNTYLFGYDDPTKFIDTRILRTKGWHKFELFVVNDKAYDPNNVLQRSCFGKVSPYTSLVTPCNTYVGGYGAIDDVSLTINNPKITNAKTTQIVGTWGGTGTVYWDDLAITRYPDSRYMNDSAAEENAWNADALAETVNFFPDVPNKDILEPLARCYAYHTLTVNSDAKSCGIKTVTLFDDYSVENHYLLNPGYQGAAISLLGMGGQSYKLVGKSIPEEFKHNVSNTFNRYLLNMDMNSYHFKDAPEGDWSGVANTPYANGLSAYLYVQSLGISMPISLNDFMNRRHMFYYNINGEYSKDSPPSIANYNTNDVNGTAYKWFVDTVRVGSEITQIIPYYIP